MLSNTTLYAQWVAGNVFKNCGSNEGFSVNFSGNTGYLYYISSVTSYRDNTNNTFTIIIPTYYSIQYGGPYGTGNGPNISGFGKLISTYATATISKVGNSYQIAVTYITKGTTGSQTQTATQILSPTYWPTTETIASVTMPTDAGQPAAFSFGISPAVTVPAGGCYNDIKLTNPTDIFTMQCVGIQAFYINFSNGTTTRVAFGTNPYIYYTVSTTTYSFNSNYARIEVANGPTPSPITGAFTPSGSAPLIGVNTA